MLEIKDKELIYTFNTSFNLLRRGNVVREDSCDGNSEANGKRNDAFYVIALRYSARRDTRSRFISLITEIMINDHYDREIGRYGFIQHRTTIGPTSMIIFCTRVHIRCMIRYDKRQKIRGRRYCFISEQDCKGSVSRYGKHR